MHILGRNKSLKLSHNIGDRIILGALTLMVGLFSGAGSWFFYGKEKSPESLAEAILLYSVIDAFYGVFFLCCLTLLWCIATPKWIENFLVRHALSAYGSVLLAVPTVIIFVWLIRNFNL